MRCKVTHKSIPLPFCFLLCLLLYHALPRFATPNLVRCGDPPRKLLDERTNGILERQKAATPRFGVALETADRFFLQEWLPLPRRRDAQVKSAGPSPPDEPPAMAVAGAMAVLQFARAENA